MVITRINSEYSKTKHYKFIKINSFLGERYVFIQTSSPYNKNLNNFVGSARTSYQAYFGLKSLEKRYSLIPSTIHRAYYN